MSLFRKRIGNNNNTNVDRGKEPYFSAVILNEINILQTSFSYLGENFTGLYKPPFLINDISNDIANFRNPTANLINDTNFTDKEVYCLGIINNSSKFITGNNVASGNINSDVAFSINCDRICSLSISTGSLPDGLVFNDFGNNTGAITGSVSNIDITKSYYDFVIRAETNEGTIVDRYFRFIIDSDLIGIEWNPSWLSSLLSETGTYEYNGYTVYPLVYSANTISTVYSSLDLYNPYNLDVTYEIVENELTTDKSILPNGLTLVGNLITGIPSINNNLDSYYFFSIKASINYNGTIIDGTNGISTKDTIFYIYLSSDIGDSSAISSSTITWISNENLGSINEQDAVTFQVKAESSDGSDITYTIVNSTLPDGLNLSSDGYLYGISPFSNGKNISETFTVRASNSSTYSDKSFYFTILGMNTSNNLYTITLPVFNKEKSIISKIIFNPSNVPDEAVFRLNVDNVFGRQTQPNINLVSSLNKVDYNTILDNLYQYYRPLKLRFGTFDYSKVYDPSGNYIYDVIYINVIDSNDRGDAFDSNGKEEIFYSQINSLKNGCTKWNIPNPTNNSYYEKTRIFPSNLYNFRNNLIQTSNREGYQSGSLATDENQVPTGTTRGIGINGTENIPQWLMSAFGGWAPAIPIVYLNTGYGETVLNNILQDILINEILGKQISIDRFLLNETSYSYTKFDVVSDDYTELGALTSFDSCAGQDSDGDCVVLYSSVLSWTQFDFNTVTDSFFIKFPPGDTIQ